jgi:hypothetical protein
MKFEMSPYVIPGEPHQRRDPESSNHKRERFSTEGYWIPGLASLAGNDTE